MAYFCVEGNRMICFRCGKDRKKTGAALVMPTIRVYRIVLCRDYDRWNSEMEQGLAEGFTRIELCDECLKDMLGLT